jgi:hypothetical protein
MTMSGKVIVRFLTPIHEKEVQGAHFSIFSTQDSRGIYMYIYIYIYIYIYTQDSRGIYMYIYIYIYI